MSKIHNIFIFVFILIGHGQEPTVATFRQWELAYLKKRDFFEKYQIRCFAKCESGSDITEGVRFQQTGENFSSRAQMLLLSCLYLYYQMDCRSLGRSRKLSSPSPKFSPRRPNPKRKSVKNPKSNWDWVTGSDTIIPWATHHNTQPPVTFNNEGVVLEQSPHSKKVLE